MIVGLGQDIVDTRRISRLLDLFGKRFEHRIFTDAERRIARARHAPVAVYARRFAAKEACAKALGSGIGRFGVSWRDIEIAPADDRGLCVRVCLRKGALRRLELITPSGFQSVCHVSMSDDPPYAVAMVVIEAVGEKTGMGSSLSGLADMSVPP